MATSKNIPRNHADPLSPKLSATIQEASFLQRNLNQMDADFEKSLKAQAALPPTKVIHTIHHKVYNHSHLDWLIALCLFGAGICLGLAFR